MDILKDLPLAPHTTFRIGGNADYFAEITTKEDLKEVVKFAQEKNLRLFFLGGGSNILFSDAGFRGLVLKMKNKQLEMRGENISAESGVLISELVRFAKKHSKDLAGFLALPGTWGGAMAGNAGIPGWEARDTLLEAEIFDLGTQEFLTVPASWFEYSYRHSRLHETNNFLIWSGTQTAPAGDPVEIEKKCRAVLEMRRAKQPAGLSAGSFFKNLPETADLPKPKNAAGWLLENTGAKERSNGAARVSDLHANFFQNTGDATQTDMLALARELAQEVEAKFGVRLEPEVKIYDAFGEIIPFWAEEKN